MNIPQGGAGDTSSPTSPYYTELNSQDQRQEVSNRTIQQGSAGNSGAILIEDEREVPLVIAFNITNDRPGSNRPTLLPLFRIRQTETRETEDISQGFYKELLQSLTPELQMRLLKAKQQPIEDQDPDLVALDLSLRTDAKVLAQLSQIATPLSDDQAELVAAQAYLKLPEAAKQQILDFSHLIETFLARHLIEIGPNDPSYDLLLNTFNQLESALEVLKMSYPPGE